MKICVYRSVIKCSKNSWTATKNKASISWKRHKRNWHNLHRGKIASAELGELEEFVCPTWCNLKMEEEEEEEEEEKEEGEEEEEEEEGEEEDEEEDK